MRFVGLRRILGAHQQAAPRRLAHLGVTRVDVNVRRTFGGRITSPHSLRSPVVRDTTGRGDTGTREDNDPLCTSQRRTGGFELTNRHV